MVSKMFWSGGNGLTEKNVVYLFVDNSNKYILNVAYKKETKRLA